jgi:hypothetical protein
MASEDAVCSRSMQPGIIVETASSGRSCSSPDTMYTARPTEDRHIDDGIDTVAVEPLAGDRHPDIRLVQMIRRQNLDSPVLAGDAEILQRLFRADHADRPVAGAVGAGLVVHRANADRRLPGEGIEQIPFASFMRTGEDARENKELEPIP